MQGPQSLDQNTWQEWVEYRKEIGKEASERSLRMALKRLGRLELLGYCPNLLIEYAIEHEWQGIHANDDCKTDQGTGRRVSAVEAFRNASSPRSRMRVVGGDGGDIREPVDEPATTDPYGRLDHDAG